VRPKDVRVVFMGSPAFAVPSLRALAETGYAITGVVTQPDRPAGRGGKLREPEVKTAARELGLTVLQPASRINLSPRFREILPDSNFPMRIFGPCKSHMIPMVRSSACDASRTAAALCKCSSRVP